MYDLTAFQRDLLYVVAGLDEPHGLAIKEELEEYYEKEVHHGRLYPNLDTIVEKGLIDKGQLDRRTNVYSSPSVDSVNSRLATTGRINTLADWLIENSLC
ncbi:transcriptional regulator, padr family protein [Natronococcus amylolyticus DSM 10524]|uniref:Transcriptional regulator, padr family protein n=1 Tax=Natronococcus amylolyticus DSM 10524 TaxID=1227497 RepID=L9X450_9EURY|nr:transcriptional regulator, padr family protein [Natronococcus amylolyticus DSM 10524]